MSISGALAASRRIGVASGVQRFRPIRLRKRPVAVWVRGSMVRKEPIFSLLTAIADCNNIIAYCDNFLVPTGDCGPRSGQVGHRFFSSGEQLSAGFTFVVRRT